MKADSTKLIAVLHNAGYRGTPGKVAILNVLASVGQPIKISELIDKLSKKVDQATVYRALESFTESRLVRKVNFNDRSTRYELLLDAHHHHHLICEKCNVIEDIDICDDKLEKKALAKSKIFGEIKHHSVEFFGLCKKCRN